MKKILILAAAIVAGVVANAATFKWTASNIYGADGTTKFSGQISLMAYATADGIDKAFEATTFTPTTAGVVNTTFSSDAFVANTSYDFYMVISQGDRTFTSAIKTSVAQATSVPTLGFGNMATATQNASNWQVVPEPTSGLMLLLGVAGLALKRKRA